MDESVYRKMAEKIRVLRFAQRISNQSAEDFGRKYLRRHYFLGRVRDGVLRVESPTRVRKFELIRLFKSFSFWHLIPDVDFLTGWDDEPRIARNPCYREAYRRNDPTMANSSCIDGSVAFGRFFSTVGVHRESCPDIVEKYKDSHGLFLSTNMALISTPRLPYPVMGFSTIDDCYEDIAMPWPFHLAGDLNTAPKKQTHWKDKKAILYWRGRPTGFGTGRYDRTLIDKTHRLRFYNYFRNYTPPDGFPNADVQMVELAKCPWCKDIPLARRSKFDSLLDYQYNMAIDGHAETVGQFGSFRGNSIVLVSSIFDPYYIDWFEENVDYFKVDMDMGNYETVMRYILDTKDAAIEAAEKRSKKATRLMSFEQSECLWAWLLLTLAEIFPVK
eukprot:GHVO01018035.1.p1 GENE.GHVO01018035.1~~GHVO01018035.1.p1  ORF type:complete len:387 (+),score=43.45 GHVO01018035.1:19-1179(+)